MQLTNASDANRTVQLDAPGVSGGKKSGAVSAETRLKQEEKALQDTLKNLESQITLALHEQRTQDAEQLYTRAGELSRQMAQRYLSAGYGETSDQVLQWQNRAWTYTEKQQKLTDERERQLLDAIEQLISAADRASELLEKQTAAQTAADRLQAVQNERTVRFYNEDTDQWEYRADEGAVQRAREALDKAVSSLHQLQVKTQLQDLKQTAAEGDLFSAVPGGELMQALQQSLASITPRGGMSGQTEDPTRAGSVVNYYFPGGITVSGSEAQHLTLAELAAEIENAV